MINLEKALSKLRETDPYLDPFMGDVKLHLERYNDVRRALGGKLPISEFANGHHYFGFHPTEDGWVFREWLPGADQVWLFGDFNGWDRYSCPLTKAEDGVWEVHLAGKDALKHGQFAKLIVSTHGPEEERIPAYIRRCEMDTSTHTLCGQIWMPEKPFRWTDGNYYKRRRPEAPLIYEAHIGMAQEHGHVGSYQEFADETLEWIKQAGYNTIQLMAIQEHPYYASFGYQVTNFFAPSHRYGTPEELKALINKAHKMGIAVLLDVVHSHACPNVGEGLNLQDGTEDQYFLPGERGWHPGWNTRIFDYGKHQVLHFLLSNLKYWQEEFHFDGFRFDGVTSMMYENHGMCAFGSYDDYFSLNTNVDARVYLTLANELIHEVNKKAVTVAEDMSGFPGMCLPLEKGGIGFDYRLAMGMPDIWIKLVKDMRQEDWDMFYLWHELTTSRPEEKSIGYAESHDQALVGDQTLMFRLADAEMYTGMEKSYHSPSMDRAVDMHKVIRFLTCSLAGNGYLNFIGNEFGHPEWVDFPREGNGWSYHYARRQWSLVHNDNYKFQWLANFDREMIRLMKENHVHVSGHGESLWIDKEKKLLIFARGGMLFAFNLHPTRSQEGVFISTRITGAGEYRAVLTTDEEDFGGQERISKGMVYHSSETPYGEGFLIYLPCRTAVALKKVD